MDTPTILVVDDTPTNLDLVQSVLEAEGFRTLTASDGPTARDLSRAQQPDLILLDVLMPGETGFETCAQLKSDPVTADIPIIFLSSLDDVKSKVAGLKIGGVDYIAKPVHGEEVLARVRVHLRIRETNRALVEQHRARLDQLRDAQQAILVRPEDCPEASFAVYYQPLEEAGGDFYDVVPLGSRHLRLLCGRYQRPRRQRRVSDLGREGAAAPVRRTDVLARGHHARRGFGDGPDAGRGAVPDGVLRAPEPADQPAHGDQRGASSVDSGQPLPGCLKSWNWTATRWACSARRFCSARICGYRAGDRFFMYSDGLIESSPGGGRREGLERLVDACVRHRDSAARRIGGQDCRRTSARGARRQKTICCCWRSEVGRMTRPARVDCEMRRALPATLQAVEEFFVGFPAAEPGAAGSGELFRGRIAGARGA